MCMYNCETRSSTSMDYMYIYMHCTGWNLSSAWTKLVDSVYVFIVYVRTLACVCE